MGDKSPVFLPEMRNFIPDLPDEKNVPQHFCCGTLGGNMWESNPPGRLFTTYTGFEDQGAHQNPSTPISRLYTGV